VTEEDKSELQKKFVGELIEFGFTMVVVVMMLYMHDTAFQERCKMRIKRFLKPEEHDPLAEEVRRFHQEISDWEHEEQGR
jgi:hypothetical protein